MTPPTKWRKIKIRGFVSLQVRDENIYRIRWRDERGKDMKRTLHTGDLEEVMKIVKGYNQEIAAERHVPGLKGLRETGLLVNEALATSIGKSHADKDTRKRYLSDANSFIIWLAENYPNTQFWVKITPEILEEYADSLSNFAPDTIKNRLKPIAAASRYWNLKFPATYHDVRKQAKIRIPTRPKQNPVTISGDPLRAFFACLKANEERMYPMAVLAFTTGMRLLEVGAIRFCDIDWGSGTLAVTKTQHHTPKTPASYRTIPLPAVTLRILSDHIRQQAVQEIDPEGSVFLSDKGQTWQRDYLIAAWVRTMRRVRKTVKLPEGFSTRKFRATFQTVCMDHGCDFMKMKRYVGHAGDSIAEQHYLSNSPDELRKAITAKLEPYFNEVFGNKLETPQGRTLKEQGLNN